MRTLRQIKDLINNIAKKKIINPQVLLRNYMMERLLERIALSKYKENFILKEALIKTGEKRGTFHVIKNGYDIIEGVFSNENMALSWKKYQKKYSYAYDISWEQIGTSIRKLWKSID